MASRVWSLLPRPERAPRESYARSETDGVWFRMAVGRNSNADPKWLLPMICRRGHVTKKDIGQIRIFDRETKFEIIAETEARFRQAVKGAAEGDIRIEPAAAPPAADRPRGPRPDRPPHGGPKPHISPRPNGPRPPPSGNFKGKPKRKPNAPN